MATITIKEIPDELYAFLKETAKRNRRSINSEVIYVIEQAVRSRRVDAEYAIARARELRALTADHPISIDEIWKQSTTVVHNRSRFQGRPHHDQPRKLFPELLEYCDTLPVVDCHDHSVTLGPKYTDPDPGRHR